jgi:anti-sigma factor RsiW
MTHPNFEAQLDAYLDGELAPEDARTLEEHVTSCPECRRFFDGRLALRAAIQSRVPRFTAPRELQENLRLRARGRSVLRPYAWRSLAIAASLAVVALGGWVLGERRGAGERLANEVLAVHIRSLMPGHLTDVQSTDQHTVKPWFNGKLDFSPPVYDFAGQGYPLLGGRLDYVDGRAVSVLVYGRRQHIINVLLWPSDRATAGGASVQTRQGYHVLHWVTASYSYWIVSDLGLAELGEFRSLIAQADSAANP